MKKIKSILVVDDNEGDQIIANYAIQEYDSDIEVFKAYDGSEALNMLDEMATPPDIILLDINMPGMNGHEFLDVYSKKERQSTVVAMLTTSDQLQDKEKCLKFDFVKQYITKPLEKEDLVVIAEKI